ncbi:MAG TPA: hypothetical protein VKQ30_13315 [Ktedonobacterales bacterium]|nr:hypothetical protein [Ktedonobacterales bacterium]
MAPRAPVESSCRLLETVREAAHALLLVHDGAAAPDKPECARLTRQAIVSFANNLDSGNHARRLYAVTYTYTGPAEIISQGNGCPPEPTMPPPHLIWMTAP